MSAQKTVGELLVQYREAAERAGDLSNPKQQNKWADRLHICYKLLREAPPGREGIIALMADANPSVREWAAAHSLQWMPERARSVLEELRDMKVFPYSLNAEMTLKEFDKGRLTFDY